jgi:spermidine synthase
MVRDTPDADYLYLNNIRGIQSERRKDGKPTGYYWDMLAGAPALADGKSALFLGVAGGAAAEAIARAWPGMQMTGVEIDPGVTAAARRWFGLTMPVVTADARRFVAEPGEKYDVIVVDLYATGQIPSHLATKEFYAAIARRLAPGGVVAVNVFGAGNKQAVVDPVTATIASVFPGILGVNIGRSNTIVLAWNKPVSLAEARSMLAEAPTTARTAAINMAVRLFEPTASTLAAEILTDERSDLEVRGAKAWNAERDDNIARLFPRAAKLVDGVSAIRNWLALKASAFW